MIPGTSYLRLPYPRCRPVNIPRWRKPFEAVEQKIPPLGPHHFGDASAHAASPYATLDHAPRDFPQYLGHDQVVQVKGLRNHRVVLELLIDLLQSQSSPVMPYHARTRKPACCG